MDATAWLTLIGVVVAIGLPLLGGLIHGVMLLTTVSSDIRHIRESVDGVKEKQDHHAERIENHEVRIVRLESK